MALFKFHYIKSAIIFSLPQDERWKWEEFAEGHGYLNDDRGFWLNFEDREELLTAILKFGFLRVYNEDCNIVG